MAYTVTRLLRRRILLYAALALLLLSGIAAAGLGLPLLESWRHSEENLLLATVRNKALSVEAWLRHAEAVAWHIAGRTGVRDSLEQWDALPPGPALPPTALASQPKSQGGSQPGPLPRQLVQDALHASLGSSLRRNGDILGLVLLDSQGQPVTQLGMDIPPALWPEPLPESPPGAPPIPPPGTGPGILTDSGADSGGTDNGVQVAPPALLPAGVECLVLAVPVYSKGMHRLGTLIMARRTTFLHRILQEESHPPRAAVAAGKKRIQPESTSPPESTLQPDPKLQAEPDFQDEVVLGIRSLHDFSLLDSSLPPHTQDAHFAPAIAKARAGHYGVLTEGDHVLAYAPVGDSGWVVAVRSPTTRLYAPALTHFLHLLPWIVLAYALILWGFWLLSRPMAGRILLHTHELEDEVTQRREAESALQAALAHARQENSRRQVLSSELISLLEGMRQNLARELHDHAGQMLTTLLLFLENSSQSAHSTAAPPSRNVLSQAAVAVRQIHEEVRNMARGLRPQTLDILGFLPAIKSLCAEMQQSGLIVHFFYEGCASLKGDAALALYRIAQGALTNVARHSGADTVHMSLVERDATIVLTVEDNGHGFDAAHKLHAEPLAHNLGLTLMQERLARYNGSLLIESAAGKGTLLIAELPLLPLQASQAPQATGPEAPPRNTA